MRTKSFTSAALTAAALVCFGQSVHAQNFAGPDQGKLLATGGATQVEGAGGGGLVPWALITGYGTRDSYGANFHFTPYDTQDFRLNAYGVAVGVFDRVEASYTKHEFKVTGTVLNGVKIKQDIFGLKVKVIGDAVYDQDRLLPQIAVGLQHKRNDGITGLEGLGVRNPTDLGARRNDGTDYYIAATKVFLAQSLLVNGTVRFTKANQFGLLGFGGDKSDSYKPQFEGSVAYLLTRKLAIGAEYRSKPRNLSVDNEDDAWDLFAAWFPTKNVSLVAAYLNVGKILTPVTGGSTKQGGLYLSVQVGF